jgi:hypothetical protein
VQVAAGGNTVYGTGSFTRTDGSGRRNTHCGNDNQWWKLAV